MKINIENYFGNDIIKLDFCMSSKKAAEVQEKIEEIANELGYNVADIDEEDDVEYIRVQQDEVENTEEEEREDLLKLIAEITDFFI